ncbi:pilus assembly protein [Altererythrobacter luteolus]|uniref:Pilus assembly protein n=1 Tax=Pontixanthobacter luteolus TaxID=295089 RepID=A0A6I4UYD0_9SPHN|nr:TadE/TadG family type IV pilus assembly protein [Pontixanthobacter luteolus]MXP46588.1 pilus assembly protein [Pontixanthobacter luteolus]
MIRRSLQDLRQNESGVSIVEFGMIAPVLSLMLIGLFDLSYNMYSNTMLHGAIQQAARGSTIEGAVASGIDARVTAAVRDVVPNANLSFSRTAYANFTDVQQPEDYSDLNGDSTCNDGEPYEDANNNGRWDADRGTAGMGGARDAVLYEVTVTYPRMFPLAPFIGVSETVSTKASSVLRNQPYSLDTDTTETLNCV